MTLAELVGIRYRGEPEEGELLAAHVRTLEEGYLLWLRAGSPPVALWNEWSTLERVAAARAGDRFRLRELEPLRVRDELDGGRASAEEALEDFAERAFAQGAR